MRPGLGRSSARREGAVGLLGCTGLDLVCAERGALGLTLFFLKVFLSQKTCPVLIRVNNEVVFVSTLQS